MTDSPSPKLQWKWVWITLAMYVFFYLVPILLAAGWSGAMASKMIGSWVFGGIVILSVIAGYVSRGVTIWEPAIAGALLMVLWYVGFQFYLGAAGYSMFTEAVPFVVHMTGIFGLCLLGAGIGEGLQNLSRKSQKTPDEG
ncbi:MAG: hypothetical protein WD295_03490 [Bacteroidota bacterium]